MRPNLIEGFKMNELEDKTVSVTFMITASMDKELNKLMKKNKWRRSAFIRVAIQKELDRLKGK